MNNIEQLKEYNSQKMLIDSDASVESDQDIDQQNIKNLSGNNKGNMPSTSTAHIEDNKLSKPSQPKKFSLMISKQRSLAILCGISPITEYERQKLAKQIASNPLPSDNKRLSGAQRRRKAIAEALARGDPIYSRKKMVEMQILARHDNISSNEIESGHKKYRLKNARSSSSVTRSKDKSHSLYNRRDRQRHSRGGRDSHNLTSRSNRSPIRERSVNFSRDSAKSSNSIRNNYSRRDTRYNRSSSDNITQFRRSRSPSNRKQSRRSRSPSYRKQSRRTRSPSYRKQSRRSHTPSYRKQYRKSRSPNNRNQSRKKSRSSSQRKQPGRSRSPETNYSTISRERNSRRSRSSNSSSGKHSPSRKRYLSKSRSSSSEATYVKTYNPASPTANRGLYYVGGRVLSSYDATISSSITSRIYNLKNSTFEEHSILQNVYKNPRSGEEDPYKFEGIDQNTPSTSHHMNTGSLTDRSGSYNITADQPNNLKVMIVPSDFPQVILTSMQAELIQIALVSKIIPCEEGTAPQFNGFRLKQGALVVVCKNLNTKFWLEGVIPSLRPYSNVRLRVLDNKEVPNAVRKAIMWVPNPLPAKSPKTLLEILKEQNLGLHTEDWIVVESTDKVEGMILILYVDEASVQVLQKLGMSPCLGLSKARFKIVDAEEVQ